MRSLQRIPARRLVVLLGQWHPVGARRTARSLTAALRGLVLDGRLAPGTQLPAERELASVLQVSRTVISGALDELRAEGLVRSRRGSASWVSLPTTARTQQPPLDSSLIDLARAAPEAIPILAEAVDIARIELVRHLPSNGYDDLGLATLRQALAQSYQRRGLPTDPTEILVTFGAHAAFGMVLSALTSPGQRIVVEQPTYANALDAITSAHLLAQPLPIVEAGWDARALHRIVRHTAARLCYLIADFHNPTGMRMSTAERHDIAEVLRRSGTLAVVDETLVELDYGSAIAPAPLAAFAPKNVITIGSSSKSHWGGLRIGWIRADRELIGRLAAANGRYHLGSPIFEQLVLTELLGRDADAMTRRRAEFVRRRDALVAGLREHCPQWSFHVPDGGLSLWCDLGAPMSSRLVLAARDHGLQLAPGARFGVQGGLERWLRVPFALPVDTLTECARILATAQTQVGSEEAGALVPRRSTVPVA